MLRVIARGAALAASALVLAAVMPAHSHAEDAGGGSALGIDYPSNAEYAAALAARCGDSGFFLRGDVADVGVYFQNGVSVVESGALLSIASDNGATTASVNGAVGYAFNQNCLPNPPGDGAYVSGYVIAPWLLGDGNFYDSEADDNDTKIQAGLTGQVEIAEAIFDVQYLTVSPYYQTDFDFEAEVYGGQVSWRPIMTEIHLGGTTTPAGAVLDWYWSVEAIADYFHVADAGSSNLDPDSNYAWLGGSFGVSGWIMPDALNDRLAFATRYDVFWDAYSRRSVDYFEANLSYALTPDRNAAIALAYMNGTDKDTLVDVDQWNLGLTLKY